MLNCEMNNNLLWLIILPLLSLYSINKNKYIYWCFIII